MTYDDAGARRRVRIGDEVEVTLPERPTTGYRWQPDVDETVLGPVGDATDVPTTPRGAGGARTLAFQALRPGKAVLRLVLQRPWESESTDEFAVELEIEPEATER